MTRIEKTVFISYRRTDASWALNIYQWLTQRGYDVFIDYEGIASGSFEAVIVDNILSRAHFVVLLSPTALDRCDRPGDWLRCEIEEAIASGRNVVPVMLPQFSFDAPEVKARLTGGIAPLSAYNGLDITPGTFDERMQRLASRFLHVALTAVLHPVSTIALRAAREQKAAADAAIVENEELRRTKAEAVRLAGELAKAKEQLSVFQCPLCGAALSEKAYHGETVEYKGREVEDEHEYVAFDCGYALSDGIVRGQCRNDDLFKRETITANRTEISWWNEVIKERPNNPDGFFYRAEARLQVREKAEAVADLKQCLKLGGPTYAIDGEHYRRSIEKYVLPGAKS
jgi:predicted RNA-binding Zn-ribbon protein involved in translation (DUF1610 family)